MVLKHLFRRFALITIYCQNQCCKVPLRVHSYPVFPGFQGWNSEVCSCRLLNQCSTDVKYKQKNNALNKNIVVKWSKHKPKEIHQVRHLNKSLAYKTLSHKISQAPLSWLQQSVGNRDQTQNSQSRNKETRVVNSAPCTLLGNDMMNTSHACEGGVSRVAYLSTVPAGK